MLITILLVACSSDDSSVSTNSPASVDSEENTDNVASDNSAVTSEIKIANDQEPAGLDPHKVPAASSSRIYSQMYEGLLSFDENMKIIGSLATEWNQENETTYVFKLKQGVTFHNGREMKAEDVKYSFERILDENTASHIRSD